MLAPFMEAPATRTKKVFDGLLIKWVLRSMALSIQSFAAEGMPAETALRKSGLSKLRAVGWGINGVLLSFDS
jgi:hypothetical protein